MACKITQPDLMLIGVVASQRVCYMQLNLRQQGESGHLLGTSELDG